MECWLSRVTSGGGARRKPVGGGLSGRTPCS